METVGSAGFRSKEGGGSGGADIRRVQRGLVLQVSAAGRFSWFGGAPVAADSTLSQWHQ